MITLNDGETTNKKSYICTIYRIGYKKSCREHSVPVENRVRQVIEILNSYPLYQIIAAGVLVVCVVMQIIFYMRYGRITTHRHSDREPPGSGLPPVSVVIVVADDPDYVIERLPLILEQNHPQYEVVVVDDGREENLTEMLIGLQSRYAHLRFTTIKADPMFRHSRKLALSVGIKAARYENIIFTDADSLPTGDKWLSIMARGFNGGRLVIGYTAIEQRPGLVNLLIRSERLAQSMPYLLRAITGRAYRGIYNNIGYTRGLFLDSRGYNHQRMTLGEDDLYIQRIAPPRNTSVIVNPQATMRQRQGGGLWWWSAEQRYRSATFSKYPLSVRLRTVIEIISRAAVVPLTVLLVAVQAPVLWIGALALFALREAVMVMMVRGVANRVGEGSIMWGYLIYDFVAPVILPLRWIRSKIKPSSQLWIVHTR